MNKTSDRYEHHLSNFQKKLDDAFKNTKKNPMFSLGHNLYLNDGRTPLFQMQGLARIEKKAGKNKKKAELWLSHAKELEDALGKYDYWMAMIENNKRWKFPAQIDRYFHSQAAYALGILEERMIKLGWIEKDYHGTRLSEEGLRQFKKSLKKADWYGASKEQRKLLELYRDEAMEIHDKIIKKELDLNHVEFGIHEFRRNVRWLGIYASALLGKVRLDKSTGKEPMKKFVNTKRSSIKHNQLPVNQSQESPVLFLPGGFYAMSDLIARIGDIKDPGLATEEMTQIGKMFGLSPATVKKHLGKDYMSHNSVIKQAKDIIHLYVVKENLFAHLADHFNKQIK
jgi:hypothetical protein